MWIYNDREEKVKIFLLILPICLPILERSVPVRTLSGVISKKSFVRDENVSYAKINIISFTRASCSKSVWGSTQNVLMVIMYWSEQISRNCTYLRQTKVQHIQ